jgi:hypothetical protein
VEYKVLEVRVRQLPTVKIPNDLGPQLDAAARESWEIDHAVPIMAKGILGGSYTDSLLVFFSRRDDRGSCAHHTAAAGEPPSKRRSRLSGKDVSSTIGAAHTSREIHSSVYLLGRQCLRVR